MSPLQSNKLIIYYLTESVVEVTTVVESQQAVVSTGAAAVTTVESDADALVVSELPQEANVAARAQITNKCFIVIFIIFKLII